MAEDRQRAAQRANDPTVASRPAATVAAKGTRKYIDQVWAGLVHDVETLNTERKRRYVEARQRVGTHPDLRPKTPPRPIGSTDDVQPEDVQSP